MAIPSGSGTEVLKRNSIPAQTTAWTEIDWTADQTSAGNTSNGLVPTNHIITILSVVFQNGSGAARTVSMKSPAVSGRSEISLVGNSLPIGGTFVWNDRIILNSGDKLSFYASGSDVGIWLSYIQQNWS